MPKRRVANSDPTARALEKKLVELRSQMWNDLVLKILEQEEFQLLAARADLSLPGAPRRAAYRIAASIMSIDVNAKGVVPIFTFAPFNIGEAIRAALPPEKKSARQ